MSDPGERDTKFSNSVPADRFYRHIVLSGAKDSKEIFQSVEVHAVSIIMNSDSKKSQSLIPLSGRMLQRHHRHLRHTRG